MWKWEGLGRTSRSNQSIHRHWFSVTAVSGCKWGNGCPLAGTDSEMALQGRTRGTGPFLAPEGALGAPTVPPNTSHSLAVVASICVQTSSTALNQRFLIQQEHLLHFPPSPPFCSAWWMRQRLIGRARGARQRSGYLLVTVWRCKMFYWFISARGSDVFITVQRKKYECLWHVSGWVIAVLIKSSGIGTR